MHSLVVKLPSLSLLSFCYVMLLCVCVLWVGERPAGGQPGFFADFARACVCSACVYVC